MSAVDFAARALAMRSIAGDRRSRTARALARSIARVGGRLPALTAAPPVLAIPSLDSGITDGNHLLMAANHDLFTLLRGRWISPQRGQSDPNAWGVRAATYGSDTHDAAFNGGPTPLVRFWTSASTLEIYANHAPDAGSLGYRLKVDDIYVQRGEFGLNVAQSGRNFQKITWGDGSAAYRQARLYEIEAGSDFTFIGLVVPPTDAVWPAPSADNLRVIVHGDSFVKGSGSTPAALQPRMAGCIANLIGQPDTRGSGVGSTGFIAPGLHWPFSSRVYEDVISPEPHVIIELGGLNDNGSIDGSATAMQVAVESWLQSVVRALPDVLIFMTGPMIPNSNVAASANIIAVCNGKKQAAARFPDSVVFVDNLAESWVAGTGYTGNTQGNGNSDWVTSADNTHPTDAGHEYLARRVVGSIAAALSRLV